MTDSTGSSIDYKFLLELFGHTCPLSPCPNINLELTSSLEAATSTTFQFEENGDQYLTTKIAHKHNPTTKMRKWNTWDCIVQIASKEEEETLKLKHQNFENSWLKRKSYAKRLNYEKL